jgi:hypothetical protein
MPPSAAKYVAMFPFVHLSVTNVMLCVPVFSEPTLGGTLTSL